MHTSLAGGAVPTRTQLADATRNRQTHGGRRLGRRGGRGRQTPLGHGVGGATQVPLLADAAQGQQVGLAGCDWPGPALIKLEPDVASRRGLGVGTGGPYAPKPTGSLKRVRSSARNGLAQVPGRRQLDTNAKAVRRRSPPTRQAGLRRPAGRMGQGRPRPVLDKLEPNASTRWGLGGRARRPNVHHPMNSPERVFAIASHRSTLCHGLENVPGRRQLDSVTAITPMVCMSFITIALCDAKVTDNMKSVQMVKQMTMQTTRGDVTAMQIDPHTFARITLRPKGHTDVWPVLPVGSNGAPPPDGSRGTVNEVPAGIAGAEHTSVSNRDSKRLGDRMDDHELRRMCLPPQGHITNAASWRALGAGVAVWAGGFATRVRAREHGPTHLTQHDHGDTHTHAHINMQSVCTMRQMTMHTDKGHDATMMHIDQHTFARPPQHAHTQDRAGHLGLGGGLTRTNKRAGMNRPRVRKNPTPPGAAGRVLGGRRHAQEGRARGQWPTGGVLARSRPTVGGKRRLL